jgi:hypothetical protein
LRRENKEVIWSSMIKDTMKRKKPSFNEAYHGYRTFSELLEDAARQGLVELERDKRSRTYVVTRFGSEMRSPAGGAGTTKDSDVKKKSRRRRGRKKTNGEAAAPAVSLEPAVLPPAAPEPEPAPPPAPGDDLADLRFPQSEEDLDAHRPGDGLVD